VDVFDYDPASGALEHRRPAFVFPKEFGMPDGMVRDPFGRLWVAGWGGSQVVGFEPETWRPFCRILVPTQLSSSCWIGPDAKTLYITTARVDLSDAQLAAEPLAGCMFRAELPAP
jgi:sugar lactone lactonase YvrE